MADIVHTGVAGWPIPLGWVVTPIAKIQRKFYLIICESAFWRLSPIPKNGKTGKLTKPNDPVALAELLKWSGQNLHQLETMGMAAIETARTLTHQQMHRQRWEILLQMQK